MLKTVLLLIISLGLSETNVGTSGKHLAKLKFNEINEETDKLKLIIDEKDPEVFLLEKDDKDLEILFLEEALKVPEEDRRNDEEDFTSRVGIVIDGEEEATTEQNDLIEDDNFGEVVDINFTILYQNEVEASEKTEQFSELETDVEKLDEDVVASLSSNQSDPTSQESIPSPPSSLSAVIPLLSHWIVQYVDKNPNLASKCRDKDVITEALNQVVNAHSADDIDEDLIKSTEKLAALLVAVINKENGEDNKSEDDDNARDDDSKDSVHGNDVSRRNRRVRIRNRKFNSVVSSSNDCDCDHGGECLVTSGQCFCGHGFTGSKCQKRIRKALLVGGLQDHRIRNDTELLAGLEVRRCRPPDYPLQVIAATGQTLQDVVIVCGGAAHNSGIYYCCNVIKRSLDTRKCMTRFTFKTHLNL